MEKLLTLWYDSGIYQIAPGQIVMIFVGLLLLYLAINRGFEPLLLVPIGFGGILANIPGAGLAFSAVENALNAADPQVLADMATSLGVASWETSKDLFHAYEAATSAGHVMAVQTAVDHGYGNGMLYNF
jgi:oxaloacetate decarboxylase beta subunit